MSCGEKTNGMITPPRRGGRDDLLIVLDVCGVLLGEPMAPLFRQVAVDAAVPVALVERVFRERFRDRLWDGTLPEDSFWPAFAAGCGVPGDGRRWQRTVAAALSPRPAAFRLPRWSDQARIWLLSNLRHEWLDPAAERLGWARLVDRTFVSSRTGLVKPAIAAYTQILDTAGPGSRLLYIDDKPANVRACARLGISGLVADADDRWVQTVDGWLAACRSAR